MRSFSSASFTKVFSSHCTIWGLHVRADRFRIADLTGQNTSRVGARQPYRSKQEWSFYETPQFGRFCFRPFHDSIGLWPTDAENG